MLLKKIGMYLLENKCVIRDIHHVGLQPLPYRMKNQGEYNYFGR